MVHQIINTKEPEYLYLRIVKPTNNSNRSNLGRKLGQKPSEETSSHFTRDQFCSRVYEVYNKLPSQITSITDKNSFKKHLKYFLHHNLLPSVNEYPIFRLNPGL